MDYWLRVIRPSIPGASSSAFNSHALAPSFPRPFVWRAFSFSFPPAHLCLSFPRRRVAPVADHFFFSPHIPGSDAPLVRDGAVAYTHYIIYAYPANVVYWCFSPASSCMYDAQPPALPLSLDALDLLLYSFVSPFVHRGADRSRPYSFRSNDRLALSARARGGGAGLGRHGPIASDRGRVHTPLSLFRPTVAERLYIWRCPATFLVFPRKMSNIPADSDRDSDCEEVERPTGGGRWSEGARVPGSAGLFGRVAGAGTAVGNRCVIVSLSQKLCWSYPKTCVNVVL